MNIPPPPLPPPAIPASPPVTAERKQLLSSIEGFNKNALKKTVTKDTSTPMTTRTVGGGGGDSRKGNAMVPPSMGGFNLLEITKGQTPRLKPVNKVTTQPVAQQPLQAKPMIAEQNKPSSRGPIGGIGNNTNNANSVNKPSTKITPFGGLSKPITKGPTNPNNFGLPIKVNQGPAKAPVQISSVKQENKPIQDKPPTVSVNQTPLNEKPMIKPALELDLADLDDLLSELHRTNKGSTPLDNPTVNYIPPVDNEISRKPKERAVTENQYSENGCAHCGQEITGGKYLEALGKRWHEEHFNCTQCMKPVSPKFYALDNLPYCDHCYFSKFICVKCGSKIEDTFISTDKGVYHPDCLLEQCRKCKGNIKGGELSVRALGSFFHTHCFTCKSCNRSLTGEFFEKNNDPFCDNCINNDSVATEQYINSGDLEMVCYGCKNHVKSGHIALGKQIWHEECFKCSECNRVLQVSGSSLTCRVRKDGSIICDICYNKTGSGTCSFCGEMITREYVEALGKKFHQNCLKCSNCSSPLGLSFFESNGALICQNCATKCSVCQRTISGQYVLAYGEKYHPECFRCSKCAQVLDDYYESNGKPVCETCS